MDTTELLAERIGWNPYRSRFDLRMIDGVLHLKAHLRGHEIRHELHWQDKDLPMFARMALSDRMWAASSSMAL